MSEAIRARLRLVMRSREPVAGQVCKAVIELAAVWVLVFAVLAVVLSCGASSVESALLIGADAARGATVVGAAVLVLRNIAAEIIAVRR